MILGGWNATSPEYYDAINKLGVNDDESIETAILTHNNVYIISEDAYIIGIIEYFKWKYGENLSYKVIDEIGAFNGVKVYDFSLLQN